MKWRTANARRKRLREKVMLFVTVRVGNRRRTARCLPRSDGGDCMAKLKSPLFIPAGVTAIITTEYRPRA